MYPISEYQWAGNVYDNFTYMKNPVRGPPKDQATAHWRVTAAVYSTTNPLAAAPPA